jgi:hypothetical protein
VKLQILVRAFGCSIGGATQLACSYYLTWFTQPEIIDTSTCRGRLKFFLNKILKRLFRRALLYGHLVGIGSSSIFILSEKGKWQKETIEGY